MFWYPLGVSPTIINLVEYLSKLNYEVNIFIDDSNYQNSRINFKNKNIKLHLIKKVPAIKLEKNFFKKIIYQVNVLFAFLRFCQTVKSNISSDYNFLIGIDTFGIIASNFVRNNIPLVYFNLELLLSEDCKNLKLKLIKFFERRASQKAKTIIIQDEKRANFLIKDNKVYPSKIVYLPVSLPPQKIKTSNFLREEFKISKNKRIVLYAGEIAPWAMIREIVQAAQEWPENYVLVLHASRITDEVELYLKTLKKFDRKKKVIFSTRPCEWSEVSKILASADVGLAFYQNSEKNFTEIGMASGKLASYLRAGLPVITNSNPSIESVFGEYNCGKFAKNPNEIITLCKNIFKNKRKFRQNALRCFKEKYNMNVYFGKFFNQLNKLNEKC